MEYDSASLLAAVVSFLGASLSWTKALLIADNPSFISLVAKFGLTIASYVFVFVKVSGGLMAAIAYLLDHHWFLLAVMCILVLLAVSALLLTFYEFMWKWQQQDWVRAFTPQPTGLRNIVIEDDDLEWKTYARQACRILLILSGWALFCILNTKLEFWIWRHYLVAHPNHNGEVQFVNCLESMPILFGAACTMFYLYPPFYTWNYLQQQRNPISVRGGENDALQTLL